MKQYTVLYIDDELYLRELVVDLLTPFGVRVIALADPREQIRVMLREGLRIDLVISDIMMPYEHGIDMLKKVKAMPALSTIPWVMLSNLSWQPIIDEAVSSGANYYFVLSEMLPGEFGAFRQANKCGFFSISD